MRMINKTRNFPKHVGVSGTKEGMTKKQRIMFRDLLYRTTNEGDFLHHGDCVGVDELSHEIAEELKLKIVIHPPENDKLRAFCDGYNNMVKPPKSYLKRNWDIVTACEEIFIIPKEYNEILRSGTWATYRYAKKLLKDITIIYPNGKYERIKDYERRS